MPTDDKFHRGLRARRQRERTAHGPDQRRARDQNLGRVRRGVRRQRGEEIGQGVHGSVQADLISRLRIEQSQAHRAVVSRAGRLHPATTWRGVGENDIVNSDVAPTAGRTVHNLQLRGLSFQRPHVPGLLRELVAVHTGGGADHLAAHQQVQAGLGRMVAAAEEELNEVTGKGERGAG